ARLLQQPGDRGVEGALERPDAALLRVGAELVLGQDLEVGIEKREQRLGAADVDADRCARELLAGHVAPVVPVRIGRPAARLNRSMRYTAIALDYDGTIAHDGEVPAHVLDGLARLKESGRKLILVTGRELDELLAIFPGITLFDRVVAENGALLYRPHDRSLKDLGDPAPEDLVAELEAAGIPLSVGDTI